MGQYLQAGICHRLAVKKDGIAKLQVTVDQVIEELSKKMDMWLYKYQETEDEIVFVLDESVAGQQLYEFLRFHYSLYAQEEPYLTYFEAALNKISQAKSLQEIVQLAKERRYPCFQNNVVYDEMKIAHRHRLSVETSTIVFLVEGKIVMEASDNFLKYLQNVIQQSGWKWSVSGAFRCFIG